MILDAKVKHSMDESVLCWLATADSEGQPNCSPKEIFTYFGGSQVIIANIASPGSVKNILCNPAVCISFVHVFKQRGFQLKGQAQYYTAPEVQQHESGSEQLSILRELAGELFPIQGLFVINIESAQEIISPGYYLTPGATEQSQVESAKKVYGISNT